MNQLRKFMYGRYGFDQLSRALVITSLLITLITTFTRSNILVLIGYIPLVYAIYRMVSKDIQKRTQENMKYCQFAGLLRSKLNQLKLSLFGTKTHKYYKCAKCNQTIRVPRGKGKICITCPKCKTEFMKRT
jgi:ABC-type transport system involved in cytochrome bd biosynthesis fused ATPase/permease subunit